MENFKYNQNKSYHLHCLLNRPASVLANNNEHGLHVASGSKSTKKKYIKIEF